MKVYCILGDERSFRLKSPAMFTAILKKVGIKGTYVPFSVQPNDLGRAIQSLKVLNMAGANVAVPYKETVMPHLDTLSEGATIIGAANTIVLKGDTLKGYNTNAIGYMDALEDAGFDVTGKTALVFGTGGAAKAVVFILNWLRASRLIVAGRNPEKIIQIAGRVDGEARTLGSLMDQSVSVDIVVNATSVSNRDESPELAALLDGLNIPGCQLVFDLNYGDNQNMWRDFAAKRKVPFTDGLTTLAYQAKRTFALWTGIQVEAEEFLKALKESPEA
jgi:shikimate dehydrogenase